MRKLLILMLVLGIASLANATIIDVVTVGVGSLGHAGTSEDPLEESETIEIKIVLNFNDNPSPPPQDGYLLSSIDLDLHVSGPGTLAAGTWYYTYYPLWQKNTLLSPFNVVDSYDTTPWDSIGDGIDQFTGVTGAGPIRGPADLIWDLIIHCDGPGNIVIDLTAGTTELGAGQYAPFTNATGQLPKPDPPGWVAMVEADLGDLVIYNVPEPATIALLGLGSLVLMRRRRK